METVSTLLCYLRRTQHLLDLGGELCPWGFSADLIHTQRLVYIEISFFQAGLVHQGCFMLGFQNQNLSVCLFISSIRIASQIQNVCLRNPDWIGQTNVWGKILSDTVALQSRSLWVFWSEVQLRQLLAFSLFVKLLSINNQDLSQMARKIHLP